MSPKYGIYDSASGWLVDTCAGMTWSFNVDEACWFDSHGEALNAVEEAGGDVTGILVVRLK